MKSLPYQYQSWCSCYPNSVPLLCPKAGDEDDQVKLQTKATGYIVFLDKTEAKHKWLQEEQHSAFKSLQFMFRIKMQRFRGDSSKQQKTLLHLSNETKPKHKTPNLKKKHV